MDNIRISVVQYSYKPIRNFREFSENVISLINQAKNSDFIVFPETFTFELQYIIKNKDINKIPEFTEKYTELFKEISKEKKQFIVAGSHLMIENEKKYNIGHIFCSDGKVFTHKKTHLFPLETQLGISPGDSLEIFETEKGKVALAICYEMEFPEVIRTYVLKGAKIILCPSYTVGEHGFWRVRYCCHASAIQNQVYIVHSCLVGESPLKGMEGWGKSSILSPCEIPWNANGIIAEARINEEMVISGDLDLKMLLKKRKRGVAPTLRDRRPEIYEF